MLKVSAVLEYARVAFTIKVQFWCKYGYIFSYELKFRRITVSFDSLILFMKYIQLPKKIFLAFKFSAYFYENILINYKICIIAYFLWD